MAEPRPRGPAPDRETEQRIDQIVSQFPGLLTFDSARGMVRVNSDLTFDSGKAEVVALAADPCHTVTFEDTPFTVCEAKAGQDVRLWLKNDQGQLLGNAERVKQSAEPIEKSLGLSAQVIDGFEEWQVGQWEGRTYLDIKKNDPEQYHSWCADPIGNAPPGGESIEQLAARIKVAITTLLNNKEYAGRKICMVTHSGIIRSALVYALDVPINNFWRLAVPTGSVSRIDFSKNFATVQFTALKPD